MSRVQSSPVSLSGFLPSLGRLAGREREEGMRVTTWNTQSLKFGHGIHLVSHSSAIAGQQEELSKKEIRLPREEQEGASMLLWAKKTFS